MRRPSLPEAAEGRWGPTTAALELWEASEIEWLDLPGSNVKLAFKAIQSEAPDSEAVLVVTGFNESFLKYVDLAADLHAVGYAVYLYDHRGQGVSGREPCVPKSRLQNAFVSSFQDGFVSDLLQIAEQRLAPNHRKVHVLAHSMGGLITAHALAQRPELFGRVVMSAPAFAIVWGDKPPGLPALGTKILSWIGTRIGAQFRLAPAPGGKLTWWDPFAPITGVLLTHNKERLRWYEVLRARYPDIAMHGPSLKWLWEVTAAQDHLFQPQIISSIKAPILVLTAELDTMVRADGQARFCANTPRSTRILVPDAYHELAFEVPAVRSAVVAAALAWIKASDEEIDPRVLDAGKLKVLQKNTLQPSLKQSPPCSGTLRVAAEAAKREGSSTDPTTRSSLLGQAAWLLGIDTSEVLSVTAPVIGLVVFGAGAATATALGLVLTRQLRSAP